ncbi:right-handed parallel beta-helix repeat-containing protein [Allocatelliglobosispora scoriae]|uniref:right-handed parallel beta-helix repeat-containing protein n=1 Tax=Allocatelliglobosispora scoriae TaxID=643052 RepID=UPI001617D8BA|nr:right-handed parallel beta-helix repeat-containing protein [Allocatelliglobosispora scoriae]
MATPAWAATVIVGPDGFATIQQGVDAAAAGDTLLIRAGTYPEKVVVGKALTVSAEAGARIEAPTDSAGLLITSDDVVVTGLELSCPQNDLGYNRAIEVASADRVEIAGVVLRSCLRGLSLVNATDVAVRDSSFIGNGRPSSGASIWADDTTGLQIVDNTFAADRGYGINLNGVSSSRVTGNVIGPTASAIIATRVTDVTISTNTIGRTTGTAVFLSAADRATVQGNTFSGGGGNGISLTSALGGPSSGILVDGNDLSGFRNGISVGARALSGPMVISNTRLLGETSSGLTVAAGAGATVDATDGNEWGSCGPTAPDHGYDGGGSNLIDPDLLVAFERATCPSGGPTRTAVPGPPSSTAGPGTGQLPATGFGMRTWLSAGLLMLGAGMLLLLTGRTRRQLR